MVAPHLSIIIPTFNSEKDLKQCLTSIVTQTFSAYEIILPDALSTDATIDIIKEFASKYPAIRWFSQMDNGVYDAMNKGIRMAKGEWIYFMGSDDSLKTSTVLHEVFQQDTGHSNVMYGDVTVVGDTSWAKDGDVYDGKFDLKKLLAKNICHQAIFYKLSYLQNAIGLFNTKYRQCADWDMNWRCWSHQPFHYLNIIVADFNGGGITTAIAGDDAFYKDFTANLIKYFGPGKLRQILNEHELTNLGLPAAQTKNINPGKRLLQKIKKYVWQLPH